MTSDTVSFDGFDIPSLPDAISNSGESIEVARFPELYSPRELDGVIAGVQTRYTETMRILDATSPRHPISKDMERLLHIINDRLSRNVGNV